MAHVLIVEDDAEIRMTMRMLLEDFGGHTVLEAADGLCGLAQLRASEHALVVLLDLLMPRLDGLGMLRAVAEDAELACRHGYVLVTVSRRVSLEDLPARLASPIRILPKPFDINELLDTVAQAARLIQEQVNP